MYGDSARYYDMMRRRRSWSLNGRSGFQGYAAFLAGAADGEFGTGAAVGAAAAEAAAYDSAAGDTAMRAVMIGVATGAITFLLNRWLGRVLG